MSTLRNMSIWNCENKTRTSEVGAISKAQKAQSFQKKYAQDVFMKSSKTVSRHPKDAFYAR